MKNAFGIVLIFSGLYMFCLSLPTELIENKVNCTKIGIASDCCETHGCVFLNCTEEMTTVLVITTMIPDVPSCSRQFDIISFAGGMALMLVVLSVIFISCKMYKAKTDGRYQQF
ncbi:hypothetical protein LSH36_335g01014 [Paralvinella palmiformis]|uniref:Uncharacterized protein n=1 Tax=Paralvinella palmiformis TaxID=53620 RepID=A0AAD9JGL0_9ANNE|nr:hypothetical protein LSH36_335g01014 [Paralvinella palmiformis]